MLNLNAVAVIFWSFCMCKPKLAIVIPCYNEEESLPLCLKAIWACIDSLTEMREISKDSFIFLIDDGSTDRTWEIIEEAHKLSNGRVKAIKFTRNFGNQNAIFAGLKAMKNFNVDAAITIDADLQQDETKIAEFVEKYKEGYDIVAGVRKNSDEYSFFKKFTSELFYKFINWLGVKIKPNHSEFRLISARVLNMIDMYRENNLFLRGLFYELGLKTAYVDYMIKEREFGKSKFSFSKLIKLASTGIVSYSTKPLRIIFFLGLFVAIISFLMWVITIFVEVILNHDIRAIEPFEIWESFISGVQILSIGIIGEYIGQILIEVKDRPRFLIDKELF